MKSRARTASFLVICLCFCGNALCQREPAGEGRPITPAGTLVIDAMTHLPAVGAMPMAMLRSPDALGHGAAGPDLLGCHNGFRVQSRQAPNQPHPTLPLTH